MNNFCFKVFSFLFFLLLAQKTYSQDLLNNKNLNQLKVDQLTEAEILKYQQQLKSSGITEQEAEQIALSRGLPPAEVTKLRTRLSSLNKGAQQPNRTETDDNSATRETAEKKPNTDDKQDQKNSNNPFQLDPKIFGAELFTGSSLSFQPDLRIATPVNYVLGPDDALAISVYGLQEASFNLTISPEGTIYIPNVGQISVSGMTVEAATARIRDKMSPIYSSLRSGASKLSVSLGKIRSIRITILGAAKSGTYTISSLSTLFNALFLAGGPAQNRSFRKIELIRSNRVLKVVDLYQFLLTANQSDNVRLQDNDVIRLPVYETRVEVKGEVKRPGIYEMLKSENASDLLTFASGFTDSAYKATVKVYQVTETERRIKDLPFTDFVKYVPNSGDLFEVSKISNRFQNRVTIEGAVYRPGDFELTPGLTAGQLIRKADGLREGAYTGRAQVFRTKEDISKEIISFNVRDAINGISDVLLQKDDSVSIFSITQLTDIFDVSVQGEVRRPGTFTYRDSLTLKDLILQAGGFSDAAFPQKIEVARVIRRDTLTAKDIRLSQVFNVRDIDDLSFNNNNIILQPLDVVTVRRLPGYIQPQSVKASGQVQFPGPYVLSTRQERVSDLLKRAGGLTPEAFADAAFLRRKSERDVASEIEAETVDKIQRQLKDTTGQVTATIRRLYDQIPLNLKLILTTPGSEADIVLKPNDELFIPKNDEEIRITGEVLFPTLSPFNSRKDLKDYIRDAGGFTDNARRKRAYVLYPNGKASSASNFLFFRNYPEIKPGSEIVVPRVAPRERPRRTAGEAVALASALASLAYIVIAIIRL